MKVHRPAVLRIVLLMLMGTALQGGQPVAPTPGPPAPVQTRQISGRVLDEDGNSIEGARVVVWDGFAGVPVFTDGSGAFQASAPVYPPPFHDYGDEVLITRNGYEDTDGWVDGTTDVTQDFRLYRPLTVTVGEAVHLTLGPDNSLCGFDLEFRCRPIHIQAPTSGPVVLDTVPDDPGNAIWINLGGPYDVQYPFVGLTHNTVEVPAGSSALIQVMVVGWVSAPIGFTLRTPGSGSNPSGSVSSGGTSSGTPAGSSASDCTTTPDPFVALGGGTCSGGGWYPPGMIAASSHDASIQVSGTVFSTEGGPLGGVLVSSEMGGASTITGADGTYSLAVVVSTTSPDFVGFDLQFSLDGYEPSDQGYGPTLTWVVAPQSQPQAIENVVLRPIVRVVAGGSLDRNAPRASDAERLPHAGDARG